MRLLKWAKDGGPNSPVDGFFLIETKSFFSVALLKFNKGSRESFHNHAFNAITWAILGSMTEEDVDNNIYQYRRSLWPKITLKSKMHRVIAETDSWCLTVRGPWSKNWHEYDEKNDITTCFRSGRKIVWSVQGRVY